MIEGTKSRYRPWLVNSNESDVPLTFSLPLELRLMRVVITTGAIAVISVLVIGSANDGSPEDLTVNEKQRLAAVIYSLWSPPI